MHRKVLLGLLENYAPCDTADAQQRDRIRAFVEAHSDCFERSLLEGHITASSWLLNSAQDSVVLTHHRKLDRWMQLGGHADGDCDVLRVALKEAQEESGIDGIVPLRHFVFDVDVHAIPARADVPAHFHYDVRFLLIAPPACSLSISSESHDLAWVAHRDIENLTGEASILRMRDKWLSLQAMDCP